MNEKMLFVQPDVKISSLATELKTNTNYLSKLIHDTFHLNFNDYINRLRIEYACQLLNDDCVKNLPLQNIWRMAGFATRSTFYEAFRKHSGATPSAFRKSPRSPKNLQISNRNQESEHLIIN
ncbi:MAG: helix-turn-helix domain-containing protein [Bacteroidales bacterium]